MASRTALSTFLLTGLVVASLTCCVCGLNCTQLLERTDVSRLEKIYCGCLGQLNLAPKMVVHQICPLMVPPSKLVQLDVTSANYRPIKDDLTHQFQIVKKDWTITADVITTIPGLTRQECSNKCTADPLCFSFSYLSGGSCVLASSCNPAGSVAAGFDMYNVAYWYQE